jgi:hypothetical protein
MPVYDVFNTIEPVSYFIFSFEDLGVDLKKSSF